MVISLAVQVVSAVDEPTVAVSSADIAEDGTCTLDLTIRNNPGIQALLVTVTYPQDAFELKSASQGEMGDKFTNKSFRIENGVGNWNYPDEGDITGDGVLVTLTFAKKDGVLPGDYPVSVAVSSSYNANDDDVTFNTEAGAIKIPGSEKITVTFNGNQGEPAINTVEVNPGDKVSPPTSAPTRTGYDFKGWYTSADAAVAFDFNSAINSPTTIYAGWNPVPEKVTVTFSGNSGEPAVNTVEVNKGDKVSPPASDPTRTGYSFKGWYTTADATIAFDFNSAINTPTTIYAGWNIPETVTPTVAVSSAVIAADTSSCTLDLTIRDNPGIQALLVTVTYPQDVFNLTNAEQGDMGNRFTNRSFRVENGVGNWNYPDEGNITGDGVLVKLTFEKKDSVSSGDYPVSVAVTSSYNADDDDVTFNTEAGTITIPPIDKIPVTFTIDGGKSAYATVEVNPGEKVSKPTDPTRSGYIFKGWYADAEMKGEFDFSIPIYEPTMIYGDFIPDLKVKVTFDPGEGNGSPFTEEKTQPFTLPVMPSSFTAPQNKTFDGWTLPGSNTVHKANTEITLTSDTTLTAHYGGCYVATAVYGSYNSPEVWTLRHFRDDVLGQTWYGRLFIKTYYTISPTLVKTFGETEWFQNFWRSRLDNMVVDLQEAGFGSTPYQDMNW